MSNNAAIEVALSELTSNLIVEGTKTTVIVGAGASAPVAKPTKDLINLVFQDSKIDKEIFDTHARIHFGVKSAENCTLEQLFSIYSKVKYEDERAVYDFLVDHQIPDKKSDEIPPLGYELLGHLLQHRLISNVISANFDELLEISLDDEIGEGGYRWIKSLSEFDAFMEEGNTWYEKPNLLKTHGTISRSLTLRPTVETVQKFEGAKARVLSKILDQSNIIIVVGYSCRDRDFKDIFLTSIRQREQDKLKIYWVDENDQFSFENKTFVEVKQACKLRGISMPYFLNMSSDDFFEKVSDSICKNSDKTIHDISRHLIREFILRRSSSQRLKPWKRKFLLEIIIDAVRNKGMFGINALMRCRRLANCCRRLIEKSDKKIRFSFQMLVDEKILYEHTDNNEIYYLKEIDDELNYLSEKIYNFFEVYLSPKENRSESINRFSDLLRRLREDFDIDIGPAEEQLHLEFRMPEFIKTYKELQVETKKLITGTGKKLKIIAHTGEWLTRDGIKELLEKFTRRDGQDGIVELIVCEKTIEDKTMHSERADNILNVLLNDIKIKGTYIRYLPWGIHTFHMALNDCGKAIYFARVAKSPTIVPIILLNSDDYKKLEDKFDKLYREARPLT